ncbi:Asp-tRNA(Asn)/Glu-tRNA(Gln) amidotransferase subunit GatC [Calycomorphotria hydatis]|uniref:Aspartyl/glutamyl-tRNA(Asn/Gln) amidotransferase subunit C n=1 Tax=Calycomorphotria hydatis TaxID=2528027 RepID=A0A517TAL3_9PLAN|nr:Asp-tRNA(Asn)/Glu-tRNA(Gln) amidotransferase subunit GatC [Calycomorphotria hydatis]QDT65410.1 Glutamyl-tRNA(Gln) amidotransferase subunit C [Calycomorphotria hydatis]
MSVEFTREDVKKIASLARLHLSSEELDTYAAQLGGILGYVEMLNEVDTDGIEPMAHAVEQTNVLREDVPTPMFSSEEALSNAPKTDGRYFLVPQIIDAE